jgi:hypothetical protein
MRYTGAYLKKDYYTMSRLSREEFERRRIERQNRVYDNLMEKPVFRRVAASSRSKTLEHRVSSTTVWSMLTGFLLGCLVFAGKAGPLLDVTFSLAFGIGAIYCLMRYLVESTALAVDLRAIEPDVAAGNAGVPDVVVA